MQHEQWATVQIEQPNFVARKGVWGLTLCYAAALVAICTAGILGPETMTRKVYRDVDYDNIEVAGTSIEYSETTGDALWKVHLHDLVPDKQFVQLNAKLQRPGWNNGPMATRSIDFHYIQEYTLFSQVGTDSHFLQQSSDVYANYTHHHKVTCPAKKRFCEPFTIYHKDYLSAEAFHIEVLFYRPELFWDGRKHKKHSIHQGHMEEKDEMGYNSIEMKEDERRQLYQPPPPQAPLEMVPSPSPTVDFFDFNRNATWTLLLETVHANKSYTRYELILRYGFLAMTVFVAAVYIGQMTKLSGQMWGYQQKWIVLLLLFLVLFDGPLAYPRIYTVSHGYNPQRVPAHTHAGFNADGTTQWKAEPLDGAIDPDFLLDGGDMNNGGGATLKDPTPQLPGIPKNFPPFMHFQPKVPAVHGSDGSSSGSESGESSGGVKTSPEDAASLGPNSDGWVGGWGASGNSNHVVSGDSASSVSAEDSAKDETEEGVQPSSQKSTEKQPELEQAARMLATMTEEEARAFHKQHKLAHEMKDVHEMEHVNNQATRLLTDLQLMGTTLFVAVLMIYFLCVLEEMGEGGIWAYFGCCSLCSNRSSSNALKGALVGSFWAASYRSYLALAHAREADPSFSLYDQDEDAEYSKWRVPLAFICTMYAIYLVWLLLLIGDAARALRQLTPAFTFIAGITFLTMAIALVFPFFGAEYTIPTSAASFTIMFGSLNLYVYTMAFAYMPKLDDMALASTEDLDDLDHIELPQSLEDEEGGFGGDLGDLDGEDDLEQYKD